MATETLSDERRMIALSSAWEIQAWASMLAQHIDREGCDADDLWMRGAAIRLDALACAVMSACTPSEPLTDAECRLRGAQHLRAAQADPSAVDAAATAPMPG